MEIVAVLPFQIYRNVNHTFYLLSFQLGYWNVQLDETGGLSSAIEVWNSEQNVTTCSVNETSKFSYTLDTSRGTKIVRKKNDSLQTSTMVTQKHLPLVCPSCKKTLSTPNLLLSHQVEMSHFVNLFCPVCSGESVPQRRQYSSLPKLKRHVTSVHLLTETLKCNLCGQSYNRHDSWKRHLVNAHRRYPCRNCKALFPDSESCKMHEFTHQRQAHAHGNQWRIIRHLISILIVLKRQ